MDPRIKFATPQMHCREGFNRALTGLSIPQATIAPFYAAFEEGHRSGDPRHQLKLITIALDGVDWRWPWWEQCATELQSLNLWPLSWTSRDHRVPRPFKWDIVSPDTALKILSNTLSTFAFIARSWAQSTNPAVWAAFCPTILTGADCPATRYMVKKHKALVEAGNADALPPYFPMDHACLSSNSRRPGGKRAWSRYDEQISINQPPDGSLS